MSSTPNPKQSNTLPGFDPMMGQLEVLEPGMGECNRMITYP
jgi:hypothetical protein